MSVCSPEEMDQWVWQFPILPMSYLKGLLQTHFARSKFLGIAFIGWIAWFRFNRKIFQVSFRSVKQSLVHCKFGGTSGYTSLNTAIRLVFKHRLVFFVDTVFGHGQWSLHGRLEKYLFRLLLLYSLIPTIARDNIGENIYPLTFPFLFFLQQILLCLLF